MRAHLDCNVVKRKMEIEPEVLIDALGVRHAPVTAPARIVSLVPSITELLFALGLGRSDRGTHPLLHSSPAGGRGHRPASAAPRR